MIYFDYAATSPMIPSALAQLTSASRDVFANTESPHSLGRQSKIMLQECREFFLRQLCAEQYYQLIFTASATEANNLFIQGQKWEPNQEVAYFGADHPSLVLAIEKGILVTQLKQLSIADLQALPSSIGPNTQLLALTMAHPQTGHLLDCKKLKQFKKDRPNTCLFLDGVQAMGKGLLPLELFREGLVDGLSFSAHKFGGPKGVAGLIIKKNRELNPLFYGGGQEFGLRSSTVPLPLIISMKEAFLYAEQSNADYGKEWEKIREWFEDRLTKIPSIRIFSLTGLQHSPFVVSCVVPDIPSDVILRHLEQKEIFASSTSACSSKIKGKNQAFLALNLPEEFHKNVLRFSWGIDRDPQKLQQDLEVLLNELNTIVTKLGRLIVKQR